MTQKIKLGVAGLRRGVGVAQWFDLHPDSEVAAVCDLSHERADAIAEQFDATACYDYEALCQSDIDAILIATPAPTHADCAIQAAQNGKHILCEVPAVFALEEAQPVVDAVAAAGVTYMFAQNTCYFAHIRKMQEIITAGRMGHIFHADGQYLHDCRSLLFGRDDGMGGGDQTPSWRAELPPIQYCTHELGPLLTMMDDRIISAVGMHSGSNMLPEVGAIDMEAAVFKTAKGAVITLSIGFGIERKSGLHYLGLYGTKGSLESNRNGGDRVIKASLADAPEAGFHEIEVEAEVPDVPDEVLKHSHAGSEYFMADDFIRSLQTGTPPKLDLRAGLNFTLPGICAHQSAEQGGVPVEVPQFD